MQMALSHSLKGNQPNATPGAIIMQSYIVILFCEMSTCISKLCFCETREKYWITIPKLSLSKLEEGIV